MTSTTISYSLFPLAHKGLTKVARLTNKRAKEVQVYVARLRINGKRTDWRVKDEFGQPVTVKSDAVRYTDRHVASLATGLNPADALSATDYETSFAIELEGLTQKLDPNGRPYLGDQTARDYGYSVKKFLDSTAPGNRKTWREIPVTNWNVASYLDWFQLTIADRSWGKRSAVIQNFVIGKFVLHICEQGVDLPMLHEERHPRSKKQAKDFLPKHADKEITAWTPEEVDRILFNARAWSDRYNRKGLMFLPCALAAFAGLRIKEIFWLAWSNIDMARRQITLIHAHVKTTDTLTLPIIDALYEALDTVPVHAREGYIVWPSSPRSKGKAFNPRSNVLKSVLKAAKVEVKPSDGWHRFRRSLVTNLLMADVPADEVRSLSRHTSAAFDRYVKHVVAEKNRKKAGSALNNMFRTNSRRDIPRADAV